MRWLSGQCDAKTLSPLLASPRRPLKTVLDASASAFGHKVEKLHRTIFKEIRSYRRLEIYARACELPRDDPRRRAFLGAAEDRVSLQFFTGTPMRHCRFTTQEYHSSVQTRSGYRRAV